MENTLKVLQYSSQIFFFRCSCVSSRSFLVRYVTKDARLAEPIIMGLLRFWPVTNAPKIVLFLNELEHVGSVCSCVSSPCAWEDGRVGSGLASCLFHAVDVYCVCV